MLQHKFSLTTIMKCSHLPSPFHQTLNILWLCLNTNYLIGEINTLKYTCAFKYKNYDFISYSWKNKTKLCCWVICYRRIKFYYDFILVPLDWNWNKYIELESIITLIKWFILYSLIIDQTHYFIPLFFVVVLFLLLMYTYTLLI